MKNPLRTYVREDDGLTNELAERLQKGIPAWNDRSMWLNMVDPVGHRTEDYPYYYKRYVGFRIVRTPTQKEKK